MARRKQGETKQVNARLPLGTVEQLDALVAKRRATVTQILITAIDRMAADEFPASRDRAAQPVGAERAPAQEGE